MKLPKLTDLKASREFIDVFRGYNHNLRIGDGEFYDMKNLTSDNYPVLSTRRKRGLLNTLSKPNGMIVAGDTLCIVDGTDFYLGHVKSDLILTDSPKMLVSMGGYALIFPDYIYINTLNPNDHGDIGERTITVECSLCDAEGNKIDYTVSVTPPSNYSDYSKIWIDTSTIPYTAKMYVSGSWVNWNSMVFVKVSATGIGKYFRTYRQQEKKLFFFSDTVFVTDTVWPFERVKDDYIIIRGVMGEAESTMMYVLNYIPSMDFVVESGNRLWGCRYGTLHDFDEDTDEEFTTKINEIYASELGNFHVWDSSKGVSTDSYSASVGSGGEFTGAITYQGHPIFFKEKCMHIVYGDYPSNYHIETVECPGVNKGSSKSLAIVNGVLYYLSNDGVYAYDGSFPVKVSTEFGEKRYTSATAGAFGNKYYISMRGEGESNFSLFVYDTSKGLWYKEDSVQTIDFAEWKGDLFFTDYADKQIKSVRGESIYIYDEELGDIKVSVLEGKIKWMAETGIIGIDSPDKKYVSRIDVRLSLEVGAVARIWGQYDSSGEWELLCTLKGTSLRSFAAPIRPKRCDHLRLRFEGEGDVKIFSICKTIEEGSDV